MGGVSVVNAAARSCLLRRFVADQMPHRTEHATDRGRILDLAAAVDLVEAEADQRRLLLLRTPDRATDLRNLQLCHHSPALFADLGLGTLTVAENLAHFLTAARRHRTGRAALREGVQGRLDHVMRV